MCPSSSTYSLLYSLPIAVSAIPAFFFFNDTATTEIYTLSLHDALPISAASCCSASRARWGAEGEGRRGRDGLRSTDRKSTRLNSSHGYISYAVFCLKKKKGGSNGFLAQCGAADEHTCYLGICVRFPPTL